MSLEENSWDEIIIQIVMFCILCLTTKEENVTGSSEREHSREPFQAA